GIWNVTVSVPGLALALLITWRSEPTPSLALVVTTNELLSPLLRASAEVLLADEVAVAVITWPAGTVAAKLTRNEAAPNASVNTVVVPRNTCAWPWVGGSPAALAKNSSANWAFAVNPLS